MSATMPQTGDVFAGKFVIGQLLGQGGMGAVYAAEHQVLRQKVAIKFLLGDALSQPEAVARFMNEARSAFTIQSEHVARVIDVDELSGLPYMIMEYLEGKDLARVMEDRRHQPLPVQTAIDYTLQALDGVHHAHGMQIVHRDLKPSNLFLAKRSDGTHVIKVLDFGISKQATSGLGAGGGSFTSTKSMLGSPLYMSPEQLRNSKSVDHRADIWALGVILHEFLTGTLPFAGENLGELFAAILEDEVPSLRKHNVNVPAELDAIVLRCLLKKREARYGSVVELGRALMPFASDVGRSMVFLNRAPEAIVLSTSSPMAMTSSEPPAPVTSPIGGGLPAPPPHFPPGASTTPMRANEGLGPGYNVNAQPPYFLPSGIPLGATPGVMHGRNMASTGSAVSMPVQQGPWQTPNPHPSIQPAYANTGAKPTSMLLPLLLVLFIVGGGTAAFFVKGRDPTTGVDPLGSSATGSATSVAQGSPGVVLPTSEPSVVPTSPIDSTSIAPSESASAPPVVVTAAVPPTTASATHATPTPPSTGRPPPPVVSAPPTAPVVTRPTGDPFSGRN